MENVSYYANAVSSATVFMLWFAFAGIFLLRKRPGTSSERIGVPRSFIGVILQGVSFAMIWAFGRRPAFSPFIDGLFALNIALQISAVLIVASSVWLAMSAVRELGRQWSLQARLIEGHELVTSGVYQIVRHPIYTAMLGMLLGTGLVYSHAYALCPALVVIMIGTRIRTNFEETLLRNAFGEQYTKWAARVPGLLPFVKT